MSLALAIARYLRLLVVQAHFRTKGKDHVHIPFIPYSYSLSVLRPGCGGFSPKPLSILYLTDIYLLRNFLLRPIRPLLKPKPLLTPELSPRHPSLFNHPPAPD